MIDSQPPEPDWPACEVYADCIGIQLDADDHGCPNHTTDNDASTEWWRQLRDDGTVDARGLTLAAQQLQYVLAQAPRLDGHPFLRNANFQRASFVDANFAAVSFIDRTEFEGAHFAGDTDFTRARFDRGTVFRDAQFEGDANFIEAHFNGTANFGGVWFAGDANFFSARFSGPHTQFDHVQFAAGAVFAHTQFDSEVILAEAQFDGNAAFGNALLVGRAIFHNVRFGGDAVFDSPRFRGDAVFQGVRFTSGTVFRNVKFDGRTNLDYAIFDSRVLFDQVHFSDVVTFYETSLSAPSSGKTEFRSCNFAGRVSLVNLWGDGILSIEDVNCYGTVSISGDLTLLSAVDTRFEKRAHVALTRTTDVDLTGAMFHESSLLASSGRGRGKGVGPCRLISLEEAEVSKLTVAGVDLGPCRFRDAHHLDQLRIEGSRQFVGSPSTWRWTRRQVIAEEHAWRKSTYTRQHNSGKATGWNPEDCQPTFVDTKPLRVDALQIAAIYRSLRKGREDVKDSPGAADFYYGEMEMRRKSPWASTAERTILSFYWFFSGYALRASRALATLAMLIGIGSVALFSFGYQVPADQQGATTSQADKDPAREVQAVGWWEAMLTSVESVIFREPETGDALTTAGRTTTFVLRAIGPVLLVLGVLSLRGRVKR